MALLNDEEIGDRLNLLDGWVRDGAAIEKTYRFDTFGEAIAFVNEVAALAEKADHHPDIDVRYDSVRLRLSTHSAGGVTGRDFALADRIERPRG